MDALGQAIVTLAGTPEGARLATALVLVSAVAHAAFGALQKGRHDPWLTRGFIDLWLVIITAPIALFAVPWPSGGGWAIMAGAVVIHFVYKLTMALSYERAAYTVVYPVMRGTGPLVTVIAAAIIFDERFTWQQWLGVALLSGSILGLAGVNLRSVRLSPGTMRAGLFWALAGGILVAVYTTYDAWGIRQMPNPFTFLAWFFFLSSIDFAILGVVRYRRMTAPPDLGPLMQRGVIGAVIAWISFGGVIAATRLDTVGEAAVLRETSTVFAVLFGWLMLGERVGWLRAGLIALVALGAVIVETGG